MGTGLQEIPFRIPERWDAAWFQRFIRDVLALADARNSIGDGLTVSGEPNTLATFTVSEDIKNLVDQAFVLLAPSSYLPNERVLEAAGGLELIDTGAGGTVTVQIANGSIPFDKLEGLNTFGVLGRALEDPGGPEQILAGENGDVLCVQADELGFTNTPVWTGAHTWVDGIAARFGTGGDLAVYHDGTDAHIDNATGVLEIASAGGLTVNGDTLAEIAQDAIGTILTDSATIDFTYDDGVPSITAAVDESADFTWTGEHIFSLLTTFIDDVDISGDNLELALGAGRDLILVHDGTNSYIRNDTGSLLILDGATQVCQVDLDRLSVGISEADIALVPGMDSGLQCLNLGARASFMRAGASTGIDMYRVNGTYAAPTQTTNNQVLFELSGNAYYTSGGPGFHRNFRLTARPIETQTSTAGGSRMLITLFPAGSVTETNALDLRASALWLPQDNQELQLGAGNDLRLFHDGTNSYIRNNTGVLNINEGATTVGRFDTDSTAGNTRFMVYDVDNGTLERVSVGAADSGGTGFKLLRIPN